MRKCIEVLLVVVSLLVLVLVVCGCEEVQQAPQVWGQGNPPVGWQDMFGNDNIARLNFVQTQALNSQGQAMAELVERVRVLEEATFVGPVDPNE